MKVFSFSHTGEKPKNEDSIGYNNSALLVCDGVGGAIKGEKASSEVVRYVLEKLNSKDIDESYISKVLIGAQKHLNSLVNSEPTLDGMATTIAGIFISPRKGVFVAHMGDSRVFLVKPQRKLFWHTWDHSFVGNLVKQGEITREDGRRHPMNNQINKALKGNLDGKISKPEINHCTDFENGDICFICTDGVLEAFSDLVLVELLSNTTFSSEQKFQTIKNKCIRDSIDNNSAIMFKIEENNSDKSSSLSSIKWLPIQLLRDEQNIDSVELELDKEPRGHKFKIEKLKNNKIKWWVVLMLIVLFTVISALYFLKNNLKNIVNGF